MRGELKTGVAYQVLLRGGLRMFLSPQRKPFHTKMPLPSESMPCVWHKEEERHILSFVCRKQKHK